MLECLGGLNARVLGKGLNANVLGRGLKLLRANCGKFEINQILIADDATLKPRAGILLEVDLSVRPESYYYYYYYYY